MNADTDLVSSSVAPRSCCKGGSSGQAQGLMAFEMLADAFKL